MSDTKGKGSKEKNQIAPNTIVLNEIKRLEASVDLVDTKLSKFISIFQAMLQDTGSGSFTKKIRYETLDEVSKIL